MSEQEILAHRSRRSAAVVIGGLAAGVALGAAVGAGATDGAASIRDQFRDAFTPGVVSAAGSEPIVVTDK